MERPIPPRWTAEDFLLESFSEKETHFEPAPTYQPPSKIKRIAFWLAVCTVLSTFWAGVSAWAPFAVIEKAWGMQTLMPFRRLILANWIGGLQFSFGLMAILVAHELGHYFVAKYYRVYSTPPIFIPFPLSPLGTFGAVIAMQSGQADRKQIFDIGLAGPLAGLLVAIPILIFGISNAQPMEYAPYQMMKIGQPLLVQWFALWLVPQHAADFNSMTNTGANPLLMAGWVGLLVTGLNMLPLGQLDGGHVSFGLLGQRRSLWVATTTFALAIGYMIYAQVAIFWLMLLLILLIGLKHPPSSDDTRQLGVFRCVIGWLSLALPILCIPANPLEVLL